MTAPTSTTLIQHLTHAAGRVPARVHSRLPPWLGNTSKAHRQALKNTPLVFTAWQASTSREQQAPLKLAMARNWTTQNQLASALAALQAPQAFAAPLLQQALKTRFGIEPDVSSTYLRLYAPLTLPLFPIDTGGVKAWTVSLVDAALHNFDAAETEQAAYTTESTFISRPSATGQFDTLPALARKISIQQFIKLCRELDIGAQYQRYLKGFFGFEDALLKAALRHKVIENLKAEAQTSLHMAQLKKDITAPAFSALQGHLKGFTGITLDGRALLNHKLSLMNAPLSGILLFAADLEVHQSAVPMVAYIPGDPQAPLKYYRDGIAFMQDLANKLRDADYQVFFSRFVNQEHRGYFFADLNSRLSQVIWHKPRAGDSQPVWRKEPVAKPNLQFYATKVSGDLYEHLYENTLNKLLNDARAVAVPTADADSKARWQRWDIVQKIAKAIIEIAAFVATPLIPPLGALMLGYSAYQLLDDVFEGVIDWAEGLKRQAFEHLMSIVEQMVQLGMFAVGAPIAEGLLRQGLPQQAWAFFDQLHPVTASDGETRLWQPDLTPYAHDLVLPPESRPDSEGLHEHAGKRILLLDGQHFAVDQHAGHAALVHPTRPHAYRPRILGNGKGAWVTQIEQPLTWHRTTLLRRLGPPADALSETRLEQAQRISGTDDDVLRKLHMDHQPPPPLLADTLKRVHIDQQLQDFIEQMSSDDPQRYHQADPQTQLWLLSQTGLWPDSKTLRFINAKGATVWEHPGRKNAAVAQIDEAQMNNGDLLATLLDALDEPERKTLLEEEFGSPTPSLQVRAAKLRKQLARQAQNKRASMFDSRYRGLEITADPRVQKIIDSAPGLPTSAAEEVLFGASAQDLLDIDQGTMPPSVVERARWARQHVRVSRAYEGLYMDALESSDTHQLALHSLENLPGWSPQVRLVVHDYNRTGHVRDAIGSPQAPIHRLLVRTIEGDYIPEDSKGTLLGETDFYTAVLQALPDAQRDALGLHIGQGPLLKQALREHALAREKVFDLLAQTPMHKPAYEPTLMRLPGGMEGYGAVAPPPDSSPEMRLLLNLYPNLSHEEATYYLNFLRGYLSPPLQTLRYLQSVFSQLETNLAAWRANVAQAFLNTEVPLNAATVAEEKLHRWIWTHELIRAWRHETQQDVAVPSGRLLHLDHPVRGDLPALHANFSHITGLRLRGYGTTGGTRRFLANFPALRTLDISNIALNTLPPEISAQPHLNALTLRNCNLSLTAQNRASISALSGLRRLDLSDNNQLSLPPNLGQMAGLQVLNLSRTRISLFPENLTNRPHLRSANLSDNNLSRLPDALFRLPGETARAFNLSGNPLSRASLLRIKAYCHNTGEHFGADAHPAERRLAQELYPTYTADQANNFIFRLPGGLDDAMAALLRLKGEYQRLQAGLQEWVVDVPERYPFIDTPMDMGVRAQQQLLRRQVCMLLEAAWRQETANEMALTLPLLGELPVPKADLKQIFRLELRGEQTTTMPPGFLERFPNLETLHIQGYALQDIPAGVFILPKLKTLIMSHCRLRLTQASADALSDLQHLAYLDLSDNALGITPDVSKMLGLTSLMMQNAGLTEVPNGVFNLPLLDQLDLRNNRISELPSDILEVDPDVAMSFVLGGNTYSPETIALLVSYYRRTAVDFGIPEVRRRAQLNPASSTDESEQEPEQ